jgi:carboxyl-terminal processing protease
MPRSFRKLLLALMTVALVLALALPAPAAHAEEKSENVELLLDVIKLTQEKYYAGTSEQNLIMGALAGMMNALDDPYTEYLPPDEYGGFIDAATGSMSGIGVNMALAEGSYSVDSLIAGSPAEKAGIKPGDVLVAVNGEEVNGLEWEEIAPMIQGEEGTKVSVTMKRGTELFRFDLVRARIETPTVYSEMLEDKVAFVSISSFGDGTAAEVHSALARLRGQGATALVLDLRGNPGGLVDAAEAVADELLPFDTPVVRIVPRSGEIEEYFSKGPGFGGRMAVLVDENTASAAEILAGALQDSGRALLFGAQTYGKARVQEVYDLGNFGGFKITTALYETPSGQDIDWVGLTPDVPVELTFEYPTPLASALREDVLLRYGSRGADVRALQTALKVLGFDPGPIDGIFGRLTEGALMSFSQDYGLGYSTVVVPEVAKAINEALQPEPIVTDERVTVAQEWAAGRMTVEDLTAMAFAR